MNPVAAGAGTGCDPAALVAAIGARSRSGQEPRLLWDELAAFGLPALLVPSHAGGLSGDRSAAARVAAALVSAGHTLPFVASAVLATRLLEAAGACALLTELATADRIAAVDLAPGVDGPRRVLTHDICDTVVGVRLAAGEVHVEVADAAHPPALLGRISRAELRGALDDAAVVAAAERAAVQDPRGSACD